MDDRRELEETSDADGNFQSSKLVYLPRKTSNFTKFISAVRKNFKFLKVCLTSKKNFEILWRIVLYLSHADPRKVSEKNTALL